MVEVVVAIVPETKIVYYLSPNSLELNIGDNIIFETDNGLFSGCILKEKYEEKEENLVLPLFNVSRIVEDEDKKKLKKIKMEWIGIWVLKIQKIVKLQETRNAIE